MGAAFASGFPPPDALPSSLSLETSAPSQEEHRFAPHRFRTAGMLVLVVILESSLGVSAGFHGERGFVGAKGGGAAGGGIEGFCVEPGNISFG